MAGRVEHLQLWTGTYQEQTGVDGDGGAPTWGAQDTFKYRAEEYRDIKSKWARRESQDLTKLSVNKELSRLSKYRFWLEGQDTGDTSLARVADIIRPVYDRSGQFVHTVVEF